MTEPLRVVADTNVLISRVLRPGSQPARAVTHALSIGQLIVSELTMLELLDVIERPKFDAYLHLAERREFVRQLGIIAELVPVTHTIRVCRDPRDDKFLELAVAGAANVIITGDGDLLALDPFEGIAIMTPVRFLTLRPE